MAWLSVSFEAAAPDVEAIADALLEAGAASVDVTDAGAGSAGEQAIYAEAGADGVRPWRRSRISATPNRSSCNGSRPRHRTRGRPAVGGNSSPATRRST